MAVYLICYDISDNRLRDEVSRVLQEYGNRVQRSVFEVALRGEAERETLRARLREVLGETPELRFYRLCERCRTASWDLDGKPLAVFPRTIIL
jgi:CRISPR-associated protein Cas2